MSVAGIVRMDGGAFIPFVMARLFLGAAYCLHVFVATQHGRLRYSFSSLSGLTRRGSLCVILHLVPVFGLILKREIVCGWC